jgi:hypothetical protein
VLLAVPPSWLGRSQWLQNLPRSTVRRLLPACAALAFFAFTRDFVTSLALFIAGLAILARANRVTSPVILAPVAPAKPAVQGLKARWAAVRGLPWRRYSLALGLATMAFAGGAFLLTLAGTQMGDQGFTMPDVLTSAPSINGPWGALVDGNNMVIGPGWDRWDIGPAGFNSEILVVIGRNTGLLGLIGIGASYLILLAALWYLARARRQQPLASTLASGLTWLIAAQVIIAALSLWFRALAVGPPLLAGGFPGYLGVLTAIGIVLGLAWQQDHPDAQIRGIAADNDLVSSNKGMTREGP